jgi:type IV secretion system protein VirB10
VKLFGGRAAKGEGGTGAPARLPDARGRKSETPPAEPSVPPGEAAPGVSETVRGERSTAVVNRARPLQSRITDALAIALMGLLGLGALVGYYVHTAKRGSHALALAQRAARAQAQADAPLPPLGRIVGPKLAQATSSASPAPSLAQTILGPPPALPTSPPVHWDHAGALAGVSHRSPAGYPVAAAGPRDRALEQQLEGPVFARSSGSASGAESGTPESAAANAGSPAGPPWPGTEGADLRPVSNADAGRDSLAALLRPTVTPAAQASVLPTERFLLPKGAFIDCTLETAIDSTLPGMTTCVTATDTFSADGTVVLLERGTTLVGETRGQVEQGQARVFVLWTEARTPSGVVVPLDSPGTDALGRSGLAGTANTHFWQRFGAAILVSVIDGGLQAGVQATGNGGTVIVNPTTSEQVMTGVLQGTINIPPTIDVPQGTRVEVLVARDVDFRSVYRLTLAHMVSRKGSSR